MIGVPMITEKDLSDWAARERLNIRVIGGGSDGSGIHREVKIVPLEKTIILTRVKVYDIGFDQGVQLRLLL